MNTAQGCMLNSFYTSWVTTNLNTQNLKCSKIQNILSADIKADVENSIPWYCISCTKLFKILNYFQVMYIRNKRIPCLELGPMPKITFYIANIQKNKDTFGFQVFWIRDTQSLFNISKVVSPVIKTFLYRWNASKFCTVKDRTFSNWSTLTGEPVTSKLQFFFTCKTEMVIMLRGLTGS